MVCVTKNKHLYSSYIFINCALFGRLLLKKCLISAHYICRCVYVTTYNAVIISADDSCGFQCRR